MDEELERGADAVVQAVICGPDSRAKGAGAGAKGADVSASWLRRELTSAQVAASIRLPSQGSCGAAQERKHGEAVAAASPVASRAPNQHPSPEHSAATAHAPAQASPAHATAIQGSQADSAASPHDQHGHASQRQAEETAGMVGRFLSMPVEQQADSLPACNALSDCAMHATRLMDLLLDGHGEDVGAGPAPPSWAPQQQAHGASDAIPEQQPQPADHPMHDAAEFRPFLQQERGMSSGAPGHHHGAAACDWGGPHQRPGFMQADFSGRAARIEDDMQTPFALFQEATCGGSADVSMGDGGAAAAVRAQGSMTPTVVDAQRLRQLLTGIMPPAHTQQHHHQRDADRCRTPSPRHSGGGGFSPSPAHGAGSRHLVGRQGGGAGAAPGTVRSPPAMQSSSKKPEGPCDPTTPTRSNASPSHLQQQQQQLSGGRVRRMLLMHAVAAGPSHGQPSSLDCPGPYSGSFPTGPCGPPHSGMPGGQYPGPHRSGAPSRFARCGDGAPMPDDAVAAAEWNAAQQRQNHAGGRPVRRCSASVSEGPARQQRPDMSGPISVSGDSVALERRAESAALHEEFAAAVPGSGHHHHHYPTHHHPTHPLPGYHAGHRPHPRAQRPPTRATSCVAEGEGHVSKSLSMAPARRWGLGQAEEGAMMVRASAPDGHRHHHSPRAPSASAGQMHQRHARRPSIKRPLDGPSSSAAVVPHHPHHHHLQQQQLHSCRSAPPEMLQAHTHLASASTGAGPARSQGRSSYVVDPDNPEPGWLAANYLYKRFSQDPLPVTLSGPMVQGLTRELQQLHAKWTLEQQQRRQQAAVTAPPRAEINSEVLGQLSMAFASQPGEENQAAAAAAAVAAAALANAERVSEGGGAPSAVAAAAAALPCPPLQRAASLHVRDDAEADRAIAAGAPLLSPGKKRDGFDGHAMEHAASPSKKRQQLIPAAAAEAIVAAHHVQQSSGSVAPAAGFQHPLQCRTARGQDPASVLQQCAAAAPAWPHNHGQQPLGAAEVVRPGRRTIDSSDAIDHFLDNLMMHDAEQEIDGPGASRQPGAEGEEAGAPQ